jgi:hypothetical protein
LTDEKIAAFLELERVTRESSWSNTRAPKSFPSEPKTLLPEEKWPEDIFGWLIVLRYDQQGNLSAHVYNEAITSEDVRHPLPST